MKIKSHYLYCSVWITNKVQKVLLVLMSKQTFYYVTYVQNWYLNLRPCPDKVVLHQIQLTSLSSINMVLFLRMFNMTHTKWQTVIYLEERRWGECQLPCDCQAAGLLGVSPLGYGVWTDLSAAPVHRRPFKDCFRRTNWRTGTTHLISIHLRDIGCAGDSGALACSHNKSKYWFGTWYMVVSQDFQYKYYSIFYININIYLCLTWC